MINLKDINGNEIIEFLNKDSKEDINNKWSDVSIGTPLVFDEQKIEGDRYCLYFTGYYNNWGTDQEYGDNEIWIDKNGEVTVYLSEPFEGDGSDEVIEEILTEWLKTHKFDSESETKFNEIINYVANTLKELKYSDKKVLEEMIKKLIKAKTYIK